MVIKYLMFSLCAISFQEVEETDLPLMNLCCLQIDVHRLFTLLIVPET